VRKILEDIDLLELASKLDLTLAELKAVRSPMLTKEPPNGDYEPVAFHVAVEVSS